MEVIFNAEFFKSQFSRSTQTPKAIPQKSFTDILYLHGAGDAPLSVLAQDPRHEVVAMWHTNHEQQLP